MERTAEGCCFVLTKNGTRGETKIHFMSVRVHYGSDADVGDCVFQI